jgi:hypothetical protein
MPGITVLGQRRAVAELDATIGRIEEQRREQLAWAVRLSAAGEDASPLYALLRLTEDYLACLRQSRNLLLWEVSPEEPRTSAAAVAPAFGTGAAGDRPRLVE